MEKVSPSTLEKRKKAFFERMGRERGYLDDDLERMRIEEPGDSSYRCLQGSGWRGTMKLDHSCVGLESPQHMPETFKGERLKK